MVPSESPMPDFAASSLTGSTAPPIATPAAAEPGAGATSTAREAYFKRAQQAVAARTAAGASGGMSDDTSTAATPDLGELAVETMGSVDPRPAYHTQREIWPVGFSGKGTFCLAPGVQEQYRCEVIDGGNVPTFRVTFMPDGVEHSAGSDGARDQRAAQQNSHLDQTSSPQRSWEDSTPGGAWAQAMAARRVEHAAWHTTAGAMAAVAQHALDPGGEDEEEANLLKEVHAALSRKQTLQNALGRVATAGYGQKASGAHGSSSAAAMQALLASDNLPVGSAETGGLVLPKTSAFLGTTAGETVEALPGALHCNNYLFREERTQRVAAAHRKASLAVAAAAMGPSTSKSKSGESGSGGGGSGKRKRAPRGSGGGSGGGASSAAINKEKNALKEAERLRIRDAELTALADSKLELKRQREQEREEKKTLQQEDKEARKRARENDRELAKQMREEDKVRREKGRDAEKVARLLRKEVADSVGKMIRMQPLFFILDASARAPSILPHFSLFHHIGLVSVCLCAWRRWRRSAAAPSKPLWRTCTPKPSATKWAWCLLSPRRTNTKVAAAGLGRYPVLHLARVH